MALAGEKRGMVDKSIDQEQAKTPADKDAVTDIKYTFAEILAAIRAESAKPSFFTVGPTDDEKVTMKDINDRLVGNKKPPQGPCLSPISVAFPRCSDVLLAHVKIYELKSGDQNPTLKVSDDLTKYFDEYFTFCDHRIIYGDERLLNLLDPRLVGKKSTTGTHIPGCLDKWFPESMPIAIDCEGDHTVGGECNQYGNSTNTPPWPSPFCFPPSCVTLRGTRHLYPQAVPPPDQDTDKIRRLFIADLVWLFYFERMGIFKILGVILDDFATQGKLAISNGSIFDNVMDDVIAMILESMVRETKTGLSSTVRDRDSSYRRCLGWTSDVGRKLESGSKINNAFNDHFNKFMQEALVFYKDKRLATAIQGTLPGVGKPSVSTLVSISNIIELLKKAFDPFDYGRNYSNTLNGIIWAVATMALIRELRTTIGIPEAYEQPYEYIPAAYDLLVTKGPITSKTNRYVANKECAINGRDILLSMQVIDHTRNNQGEELERFLNIIEPKVEGYRTAYHALTGVDLGVQLTSTESPSIEQKA